MSEAIWRITDINGIGRGLFFRQKGFGLEPIESGLSSPHWLLETLDLWKGFLDIENS